MVEPGDIKEGQRLRVSKGGETIVGTVLKVTPMHVHLDPQDGTLHAIALQPPTGLTIDFAPEGPVTPISPTRND